MAEHGLDEPDVGSVLQHQGRHGVSEQVAGAGLADVCMGHIVPNKRRQTVRRERLAKARQEQGAIVGPARKLRSHVIPVFDDPRRRSITYRDHAVLLPLAHPHRHRATLGIEVIELEIDDLHSPHAGRIERLQNRSISDAFTAALLAMR